MALELYRAEYSLMSGSHHLHAITVEKLPFIQQRQTHFNEECANALKWSYRVQGWTAKSLEKQITGIKTATWGAYGQQSYSKKRTLHVLVLFSWLSQICIKSLFSGNNIEQHYGKGKHRTVVECMAYASKLSTAQFRELINALLLKSQANLDKTSFSELLAKANIILQKLEYYRADHFLMPMDIDVDEFKYDFYRSVARVLYEWRTTLGVSEELMAAMLGESVEKYRDYENPQKLVSIPVTAIMRLIIDFKADEAAPIQFSKHMEVYTGLKLLQGVQKTRKELITLVTSGFDRQMQQQVANFVKVFVKFY